MHKHSSGKPALPEEARLCLTQCVTHDARHSLAVISCCTDLVLKTICFSIARSHHENDILLCGEDVLSGLGESMCIACRLSPICLGYLLTKPAQDKHFFVGDTTIRCVAVVEREIEMLLFGDLARHTQEWDYVLPVLVLRCGGWGCSHYFPFNVWASCLHARVRCMLELLLAVLGLFGHWLLH